MVKSIKLVKKVLLVLLSCIWMGSLLPPIGASAYDTSGLTLRSDQDVQQFLLQGSDNYSRSSAQHLPRLFRKNVDQAGQSNYTYQQTYQGIPVYGRYANVSLDSRARVNYVKNDFQSDIAATLSTTSPSQSRVQAINALLANVQSEEGYVIDQATQLEGRATYESSAELIIYPFGYKTYLAYEVKLGYLFPQAGSWVGYVDAITGDVIDKYSKLHQLKADNAVVGSGSGYHNNYTDLKVYYDADLEADDVAQYYLIDTTKEDMFNPRMPSDPSVEGVIWTLQLDGNLGYTDVTSATYGFDHQDAVDAHYNTGLAYDFYLNTFDRDSFDDQGTSVVSVVYFEDPDNTMDNNAAYLSGLNLLIYGRATGSSSPGGLDCVTCSADIVVHEYTHAVTEHTAGLEYRNQQGALNEAISDIMAAVADHDGDEWLIGEETGAVERSMENPDLSGQPAHMDDYEWAPNHDDYGGVHTNSGIVNHAAYLIATGIDELAIAELDGREFLGAITYHSLMNHLNPTSDFQDARDAFIKSAVTIAGTEGLGYDGPTVDSIKQAVKDAWAAVGLPEGQYNELSIKSFSASVESGNRAEIIDDYYGEVVFFVPYGTNVRAVRPAIEVSTGADYTPKPAYNFDNPDRAVAINVFNELYYRDWLLIAIEEPRASYSALEFTESTANDGSISSGITITLVNDEFTGDTNDDFINDGKITVTGVPEGLTFTATKVSNTQVAIALMGQATSHTNTDDITNLKVQIHDTALRYFPIWQLSNDTFNLRINFNDPLSLGGGGGFFFIPSSPTSEVEADATSGVTIIPPQATATTNADDQSELSFDVSADDLKKSFELLKNSVQSTPQAITVTIAQDSDLLHVRLPATALLSGVSSSPDAKIVIQTGAASYELPVSLLDYDQLARQLGVKIEDLTVTVSLNQVSKPIEQDLDASAAKSKLQLVGDPIDFVIEASAGDKSLIIEDFGGTYVNRSIVVQGQLSAGSAVVLRYDPATKRFTFVPAQFRTAGNKTKVSFKRNGNSIYTVAKFTKIFSDINNHWAKSDIEYLASKTIITGYTDTEFAPNQTITRAEFATILTRALGLSGPGKSSTFSDVQAATWYADAVAAAVNAKLVSGYEDDTFQPNANITREQMAVMIANALTYAQQTGYALAIGDESALLGFTDGDNISAWARSSVAIAVSAKIISGSTDGRFNPERNATRSEAAVMVRRLLSELGIN